MSSGSIFNPPSRAVVFSYDEKTQCQALDRTQPSLPMKPGRAGTMTHDYKRNGTIDLFAAMNIATGEVLTGLNKGHAGADVLKFFKQIDASVPRGLAVHVVLDNLSAHSTPEIKKWLAHRDRSRWHLHFTPTSSSWLNLIERWFKDSPTDGSAAAPSTASTTSPKPSPPGPRTGTTTPSPSSGRQPPTTSSGRSNEAAKPSARSIHRRTTRARGVVVARPSVARRVDRPGSAQGSRPERLGRDPGCCRRWGLVVSGEESARCHWAPLLRSLEPSRDARVLRWEARLSAITSSHLGARPIRRRAKWLSAVTKITRRSRYSTGSHP